MSSEYRMKKPRDERKIEATHILTKYPKRIAIVLERSKTATIEDLHPEKLKWLVPQDMNVSQFIKTVHQKKKFAKVQGEDGVERDIDLYLFINNVIIDTDASIQYLFDKNKHTDGFLYMKYSNKYDFGKKMSSMFNSLNHWGTATIDKKGSDVSTSELEITDLADK